MFTVTRMDMACNPHIRRENCERANSMLILAFMFLWCFSFSDSIHNSILEFSWHILCIFSFVLAFSDDKTMNKSSRHLWEFSLKMDHIRKLYITYCFVIPSINPFTVIIFVADDFLIVHSIRSPFKWILFETLNETQIISIVWGKRKMLQMIKTEWMCHATKSE